MSNKKITSGKRKTAVARAVITEGVGKIIINNQDHKTLGIFERLKIEEPLRIAENILGNRNFNVNIEMKGGGEKGQVEAARLALSKAIVSFAKRS